MFVARDYQEEAIANVHQRVSEGHTPIVSAATGSGKSIIAGLLAKEALDAGKRVLFISFREEILDQIFGIFNDICGRGNVGYLMRDKKPWWFYPPVTVASADTLKARWHKSDSWKIPADLVLVDEAHLSLSPKMTRTVMPHYKEQTVIGFSATPARRTGLGLGSYYSRIVQVRSVQQLIDDGHLAACEYWAGPHAATEGLRTDSRTRDFREGDIVEWSKKDGDKRIGDIVDNWLRLARDRHTIVFAVDIADAVALTERFQAAGVAAEVIHSKMRHEARTQVSDQFRAQEIQVLINVGVCVYGYDVPSCNCVVLGRPTKSIVMHHQQIGRGIRPNPDGGHTMILDHADNVRRLGCIEDEIRWRLGKGKEAAVNTTRDGDATRNKKPEAPPTECGNCHYIFVRSRICDKCGWEKPIAAREVDTIQANLERIRKARSTGTPDEKDQRTYYLMAKGWCELNGKDIGMAYHQTKRKLKFDAPWAWRNLPSFKPDARVSAEMHKALQDYARRMSYAKRKKKKATA
jgi:superfamily II DNA or RNA helicase